MLDGMDWVSDREWERAIYQRMSPEAAFMTSTLNYPLYRRPRPKIPDGLTEEDLSDG